MERATARFGNGTPASGTALLLVILLSSTACTVVRGGEPASLDALSVGTLQPGASSIGSGTPAIFAAAGRALALGEAEWQDGPSGAWGTVRRTGPDDARACTPAELTVHDYRGVRVESHDLCPVTSFAPAP